MVARCREGYCYTPEDLMNYLNGFIEHHANELGIVLNGGSVKLSELTWVSGIHGKAGGLRISITCLVRRTNSIIHF